jgi:hypothetical protein
MMDLLAFLVAIKSSNNDQIIFNNLMATNFGIFFGRYMSFKMQLLIHF